MMYEQGFVNGIQYQRDAEGRMFFDAIKGSLAKGEIKTWSVFCEIDSMTDKKSCNIHDKDARLFISIDQYAGINYVDVVGNDFPGKQAVIRVNKMKPAIGVQTGSRAKKLIGSMTAGSVVRTRRYEWPYDVAKEGMTVIYGLPEAIQFAKWALAGNYQTAKSTPQNSKQVNAVNDNDSIQHSHGARSHSHALPVQGKAHRHGSGAVGK